MASKIFRTLLEAEMRKFIDSFSIDAHKLFFDEDKKALFHAGEYGSYRETLCKNFLRLITSGNLDISTGFVITGADEVSTQCDLVLYDKNNTPLILADDMQRFFPIETVAGVGEIKSTLSRTQFSEAIIKLAQTKKLKKSIKNGTASVKRMIPGTIKHDLVVMDQMFTFIICKKLDFNLSNIEDDLVKMYGDTPQIYWHNIILSIEDGVLLYLDGQRSSVYPFNSVQEGTKKEDIKVYFAEAIPGDEYAHFSLFAQQYFLATTSASIFFPEMFNYIA